MLSCCPAALEIGERLTIRPTERSASEGETATDMRAAILCLLAPVLASYIMLPLRRTHERARDCRCCAPDEIEDRKAENRLLRALVQKRASGMSDDEIARIAEDQGLDLAQLDELQGTRAGELYDSMVDGGDEEDAGPPTSGAFGWGRWSQSPRSMSLELYVSAGTRAADVAVSVAAGFLVVSLRDEPLLSGLLAQPVLVDEVSWALEDDEDAETEVPRRILFVELPKKGSVDATGVALFDSLRVEGAECAAPGLVDGTYYVEEGAF